MKALIHLLCFECFEAKCNTFTCRRAVDACRKADSHRFDERAENLKLCNHESSPTKIFPARPRIARQTLFDFDGQGRGAEGAWKRPKLPWQEAHSREAHAFDADKRLDEAFCQVSKLSPFGDWNL